MGSHEARVEASKRLGKEANYEASLMTHSHSRGRKDAAWASAVKGGEEEATALKREGSGEGLRARLREELDAQQLRTFTRWWNSWLASLSLSVNDLCEDVRPGVLPIQLLEVLSDSSCGKYNKKPKSKFMMLENQNVFLSQLKAKSIKLVNIGAEDLAGGDRKLVLGLTWTLILRYEIHKFGGNEAELLTWTKDLVQEHYGVSLDGGWAQGFSNGHAFCAIGEEHHTRLCYPPSPAETPFGFSSVVRSARGGAERDRPRGDEQDGAARGLVHRL